MLAQCPLCQAVKMQTDNKYQPIVWQASIAKFGHLPTDLCYTCTLL